jgi:hypothetical protein
VSSNFLCKNFSPNEKTNPPQIEAVLPSNIPQNIIIKYQDQTLKEMEIFDVLKKRNE